MTPGEPLKAPKILCVKCQHDVVQTFHAGGVFQAKCLKCRHVWSLGMTPTVRRETVAVDTPHGTVYRPQTVQVLTSVTEQLDFENKGFRDPSRNFRREDDE